LAALFPESFLAFLLVRGMIFDLEILPLPGFNDYGFGFGGMMFDGPHKLLGFR
jgi:hypothetical protein